MIHTWSVVCSQAILDAETHNYSLINVLEQITFGVAENSNLPENAGIIVPFAVISAWVRSDSHIPERANGRVVFQSPSGEELLTQGFVIDLSENSRFKSLGKGEGLPFRGSGIYAFLIQRFDEENQEWATCAKLPIEVVQLEVNEFLSDQE